VSVATAAVLGAVVAVAAGATVGGTAVAAAVAAAADVTVASTVAVADVADADGEAEGVPDVEAVAEPVPPLAVALGDEEF
jgi:hypothetical protein